MLPSSIFVFYELGGAVPRLHLILPPPLVLFLLSHCHFVLTPSPQSLSSSSSGDEMQLFDGVLPLAGERHPSGVGVATPTSPTSSSYSSAVAAVHAVVVVARRRVGVHLDHVVAVHGRRDADVLLRLGLLVVAESAHGRHHPAAASSASVAASHHQPHRQQPVLQAVGRDQEPFVGPENHRVVYQKAKKKHRKEPTNQRKTLRASSLLIGCFKRIRARLREEIVLVCDGSEPQM